MTLTAETDEPTYTPLYLGMNSEDSVCQRHSMTVHCDQRAAELGISGSDSFGDPMQLTIACALAKRHLSEDDRRDAAIGRLRW